MYRFFVPLKQTQNFSNQLNSFKTEQRETALIEKVERICNEWIPSKVNEIKIELEKNLAETTFKTSEFSQQYWAFSIDIEKLNQLLDPKGFMDFYRHQ